MMTSGHGYGINPSFSEISTQEASEGSTLGAEGRTGVERKRATARILSST